MQNIPIFFIGLHEIHALCHERVYKQEQEQPHITSYVEHVEFGQWMNLK